MTTNELLAHLHHLGVRLRVEGDRLRFSAPAGALDANLRSELSRRKEELLTVLRVAQASHEAVVRPIVPIPRGAGRARLPLSFAQQRLWFLEQLEPGTAAYHLAAARRLKGEVNVTAMRRSIAEIVRRHEILRTTFSEVDGRPAQRIAPRLRPALGLVDLGGLVPAGRESQARRLAAAEARRPFDLTAGPLSRMSLLRLREEEYVALVTMHHIVSDGWSVGVFLRELAVLYEAFSQGRPSPLAALEVQYADFASWQRQGCSGAESEAGLGYWRTQLDGSPHSLELPADRPRPARETFRGSAHPVALSTALHRALAELSRRQEVTPFMILLAAFQVVLSRYSGQEDVVVGSPIAGRNTRKIEDLIGLFVNNLVLRTDLSGNPSFRQLLSRIRRVALDAYVHQDVAFELLVEQLHPQRDLSRNPIFQVMFALDQEVIGELRLPGLELSPFPCATAAARLDLTFFLREGPAGFTGEVEYNTDLFDATTIARLAGSYLTLLAGAVADPERRLGDLPLMSPAQRHQLRREWNDTGTEPGEAFSLTRLVAAQVERAPAAVAVGCGESQLTYRELNRRSNQLAHHLIGLGVGPEVLVGICAERSPEMMVGLLAVLKAGGAYMPLDPSFPRERLTWVLEATGSPDGRAPVVLCHRHLLAVLGSYAGRAVFLDADRERFDRQRDDDPGSRAEPGNLAYAIFTSGSTGRPKGVRIDRRALDNFLGAMGHRPGLGADDVLVAVTTLSFDIAALELFLPLVVGARVEIAGRETAGDGVRLSRQLEAVGATAMQATPVTWRLLLEAGWQGGSSFAILCGGEALPGELAARLAARGRLWNLYGPTETTIWSTLSPVTRRAAPITIGRPIANTRIRLLDRRLVPVPQGASGHLHIGGAGLARDYLGRPALSAERFIPDPFCAEPGGRLYRTGDLARRRPSGTIECLGRIDHQVKIRGFRIELGEIEAVLAEHPAVRAAVVVARDAAGVGRSAGDEQLVAYVVGEGRVAAAPLRDFLRRKLPEYMLPGAFVELERFPLTANGKVDRAALPRPAGRGSAGEYVAPRSAHEELLAEIWRQVLGADRVGAHDNFFEIGGHSLLATQVTSRVRELVGVELGVRAVFERPTVAGLAAALDRARQAGPSFTIAAAPRDADLPLSHSQLREWFLDQLEPGNPAYHIPAAVRLRGRLDRRALAATVTEIVRRHESLRTTFPAAAGQPVQVIASPSPVPVPLIDLEGPGGSRGEAEALRLAAAEARRPFDLARGPLLRIKLLRLGRREHVLCLTMHHIVSDGWSMSILIREMSELYAAFADGKPSPLPELAIQYADFAAAQRQWLRGETLERLTSYWQERLGSLPPVLRLPTDRPRSLRPTTRSSSCPLAVDRALSSAVKALSNRLGTSLFMTMLAAFQALLGRCCGQWDVSVGTFIAGRNRPEIEPLIGFFVNTLVLRTDLGGDPPFAQLAGRVREVTLGAYEHQDLPVELLLDALKIERSLTHTPLFQVMLVLQNLPRTDRELPGLSLSPFGSAEPRAHFDLALWLSDAEDGLSGYVEYSADLFDLTTVRRLATHFLTLLEAAAGHPGRRIWQLPVLSPAARHQLFVEWNDVGAPPPEPTSFHQLFEVWAERLPEAIALVSEEVELSYRELNARANRLGRRLRRLGVGPEISVGIFLEYSPEVVVAALAVMKSGGTYLPLDAMHARRRIGELVEGAGARVLLTRESLRSELPAELAARVVCLDSEWDEIARESAGNLPNPARGPNLVYLVYTSGTSGRPKAVMISHAALMNIFHGYQLNYDLDPGMVHLQMASFSFDVFTGDLLRALGAGGKLVMCPREVLLAPKDLYALIRRERVNCAEFVPAVVRELMSYLGETGQTLAFMRLMIVGSDLWHLPEHETLKRGCGPGTRLINSYGVAEATIDNTYFEHAAVPLWDEGPAPIGRPFGSNRIYLLDRGLRSVPAGAGELCVGGSTLARGYLGRPAMTAERFVPDPFRRTGRGGERLYRTGDLARYLADGCVQFLGRLDSQVKLRGFRIEPGEIEAILGEHPEVIQGVVIAREDIPGNRYLAAYVVSGGDPPPPASELRRFLKQRLPDYMVPSVFVDLDELPLNNNNKVDRRRLPAPSRTRPEPEGELRPPETPIEEDLADIFAEVVGVDEVGRDHDFFDLGGHSLLATQAISRIRETFEIELPLRSFFEAPTVAELALVIEKELIAMVKELDADQLEALQ